MVRIAIRNLYVHQPGRTGIALMNPLTTGFGDMYSCKLFDVILADLPFSGKAQDESIHSYLNEEPGLLTSIWGGHNILFQNQRTLYLRRGSRQNCPRIKTVLHF